MSKLESIIIVSVPRGYVATLRFSNYLDDKVIASRYHNVLYQIVEAYVAKTARG